MEIPCINKVILSYLSYLILAGRFFFLLCQSGIVKWIIIKKIVIQNGIKHLPAGVAFFIVKVVVSFLPIFEGNIFSHNHWFGHCPFFHRWLNTTPVKKLALCYTRNTIIFTSNLHCIDYLSCIELKIWIEFAWRTEKERTSLSWLSAGQREFGTGLGSVRFRYSK